MGGDPYRTLGVPNDASTQDIKRAFRLIARECHPDVAGADDAAADRFKEAREAYEILMDPARRARVDRRHASPAPEGGSFFDAFYRHTGNQQGRRRAGTRVRQGARSGGNDLGLDDLFQDFQKNLGQGRPRAPQTARPATQPPVAGGDIHIELEVPRRVATAGGSVTARYSRLQRPDDWRPDRGDAGLVRVDDLAEVRIVPGTRHGALLRERALGDAGAWGGPHGDLVVRVRVAPDLEPEQRTLGVDVAVAVLGGEVDVQTAAGAVRLTVPPGSSGGTRLRLPGRGEGGADLVVTIQIVVPQEIDAESKELMLAFAARNPSR